MEIDKSFKMNVDSDWELPQFAEWVRNTINDPAIVWNVYLGKKGKDYYQISKNDMFSEEEEHKGDGFYYRYSIYLSASDVAESLEELEEYCIWVRLLVEQAKLMGWDTIVIGEIYDYL